MFASSSVLIASTGPYFPSLFALIVLLFVLIGPFLAVALGARSLFGSDPMSWWLVGLMALGVVGTGLLTWPLPRADGWTGFWGVWRIMSVVALVLLPVVLFMEAGKRDFFRRPDRPKKSSVKKRRAQRERIDRSEEPPASGGVFVRE